MKLLNYLLGSTRVTVPQTTLQDALNATVGYSMGVRLRRLDEGRSELISPVSVGFLWLIGMLVFFCLPVWLLGPKERTLVGPVWLLVPKDWTLVRLAAWGALYLAWAVFTAQLASRSARALISVEIEPLLSRTQEQHVVDALCSRFARPRVLLTSLGVAALALAASVVALPRTHMEVSFIQVGIVSVEFYLLYVTAVQATDVARFYGVFAEAVEKEPELLFVLAPSRSPLVEAVRRLGEIVVLFWFGIMISILTLVIFLDQLRDFVLLFVSVASFFSFLFGSLVFLRAQGRLRAATRQAAAQSGLRLDREARSLLSQHGQVREAELTRLEVLARLHLELSRKASAGSIFLTALSVITPFASAVSSVLIYWLTKSSASP